MHWTYTAEWNVEDDLQQGDFLVPTAELSDIFKEVHPHFGADKYLGFSVATQSCDLVRRKKRGPKAKYISIAVVRSLKEVSASLLEQVARPVIPGVFPSSAKLEARQLLVRLFNQNEQSFGLFYLHPDGDISLGESAVVFLRVTVSLRAQHYNALVKARRGRLNAAFQAKLGWLLGNLYSRTATPDWSDHPGCGKQCEELVKKYLTEQIPGAGPTWIDDMLVRAGRSAGVVFENRDRNDLIKELDLHRPKPRLERIVDAVLAEVARVVEPDAGVEKQLRNRLLNPQTPAEARD